MGILVSILCIALALRQVNYSEMWEALQNADYGLVMLSVLVLMISHYIRAMRWRLLLLPVKPINDSILFFSAGHRVCSQLVSSRPSGRVPARFCGEQKKEIIYLRCSCLHCDGEAARIILSLLMVMAITLAIYPGSPWLINSGYMMLLAAIALFVGLVLMRRYQEVVLHWLNYRLTFGKINLGAIIVSPHRAILIWDHTLGQKAPLYLHGCFICCHLGLLRDGVLSEYRCFSFGPNPPYPLVCRIGHPCCDDNKCSNSLFTRLRGYVSFPLPVVANDVRCQRRGSPLICDDCTCG